MLYLSLAFSSKEVVEILVCFLVGVFLYICRSMTH